MIGPLGRAISLQEAFLMETKSELIISFMTKLSPVFITEPYGGWEKAISISDGTTYSAVDESEFEEERGLVRVCWQGDVARQVELDGEDVAAFALERYVRFHTAGQAEEIVHAELWHMARHFHFKTGCNANMPMLKEPDGALGRMRGKASRMGEGLLVNLVSEVFGF